MYSIYRHVVLIYVV